MDSEAFWEHASSWTATAALMGLAAFSVWIIHRFSRLLETARYKSAGGTILLAYPIMGAAVLGATLFVGWAYDDHGSNGESIGRMMLTLWPGMGIMLLFTIAWFVVLAATRIRSPRTRA